MKNPKDLTALLGSVKKYWQTPPEGRYMNFREILSLSIGGFGAKFLLWALGQLGIYIGNGFVCNTIGIKPGPVYVIYILSVISSFPLGALRARMIDNSKSMKGKYRPFILSMGLPSAILGIIYVWLPYEKMSPMLTYAAILFINVGLQFFFNFFTDVHTSIINVLSPDTIERTDVISIKMVIESLAPSICSFMMPLVAKLITGKNTLFDIRIYRIVYPPMIIIGFLFSLLIYFNTEEKIIQPRAHAPAMKFTDALRAVARNKYFWIISLASWVNFLETAINNILSWTYNYQNVCSAAVYSVITLITGNASLWSMLLAPFAIRKYGKRTVLVVTNLLNIVFIGCMLPVVHNVGASNIIWPLVLCTFLNNFVTTFGSALTPGINADIRDYQQYVTGQRIDGMFVTVGLIGTAVSLATGSVLPTLYSKAGLNETVALSLGYDASNVYNVLYHTEYYVRICSILIAASVIGAVLNVIPYFFYDLTETKQKAMIQVLKIRAIFEDAEKHILTEEKRVEALEIIRDARRYANAQIEKPSTDALRQAKKEKDRAAVKQAKADLKRQKAENEKIAAAKFVWAELHKFESEGGKEEVRNAEAIVKAGLQGFLQIDILTKKEARAMPKTTQQEKTAARNAMMLISKMKTAKKTVRKYYPNGIEPFDDSQFEAIFGALNQNDIDRKQTVAALKNARERKNRAETVRLNNELNALHRTKREIENKLKLTEAQNSVYHRAAAPYLDAVSLLKQKEWYETAESMLSEAIV